MSELWGDSVHIWTHRLCSRVLISLPSWNDKILLDQKDCHLPRQAVPDAHWLWHRLTDDPTRVFRGLVPQRPSQILLHKKTAHSQLSSAPMAASHPWYELHSYPPPSIFHVCGLYVDRRRVLGACIMYLFFPCAVFCLWWRLRKLRVVNRPRSARVQADLTTHLMPTRGSEAELATAARNAGDLTGKTGRANPSVTSDVIQTPGRRAALSASGAPS